MEIIKFKEKWKGMSNTSSDESKINETLKYEITLHIATCGVKKLFDRKSVKCQACVNRLLHGHNLCKMSKM